MASWYYPNTGQQAPLTLHRKQACRLANFGSGSTRSWTNGLITVDTRTTLRGRILEQRDYQRISLGDVKY
jgi:hypothetical protein